MSMPIPLRMVDENAMPALPPLPEPDRNQMRGESCCGTTFVCFLITLFVSATVMISRDIPMPLRAWPLTFILAEAVLALAMLAGLMFGDPGVVRRTPSSVLPVPQEVEARLAAGQGMEGLKNLRDGKRSYCVRCLVWRDHEAPLSAVQRCYAYLGCARSGAHPNENGVLVCKTIPHHCSICQRCVLHFDHHCGVFGRCIAGRGLDGNMKYFMTIIWMAFVAFITTGITGACGSGIICEVNSTLDFRWNASQSSPWSPNTGPARP